MSIVVAHFMETTEHTSELRKSLDKYLYSDETDPVEEFVDERPFAEQAADLVGGVDWDSDELEL